MPARFALSLTMCQTTFSVMPFPQTEPLRLTHRNTLPSPTPAAVVHSSIAAFTQSGTRSQLLPALQAQQNAAWQFETEPRIYKSTRELGGSLMPAFRQTLTDSEIDTLIDYTGKRHENAMLVKPTPVAIAAK